MAEEKNSGAEELKLDPAPTSSVSPENKSVEPAAEAANSSAAASEPAKTEATLPASANDSIKPAAEAPSVMTESAVPTKVEPAGGMESMQEQTSGSGKKVFTIILAIIIVLGIGYTAYRYFGSNSSSVETETSE